MFVGGRDKRGRHDMVECGGSDDTERRLPGKHVWRGLRAGAMQAPCRESGQAGRQVQAGAVQVQVGAGAPVGRRIRNGVREVFFGQANHVRGACGTQHSWEPSSCLRLDWTRPVYIRGRESLLRAQGPWLHLGRHAMRRGGHVRRPQWHAWDAVNLAQQHRCAVYP